MGKLMNWVVGAIVVAIVGGIGWKILTKPPSNNNQETNPKKQIELNERDRIRGNKEAAVVLVEYGDFQCPACGAYYPVVKRLKEELGKELAVVFRQYPLTTIHNRAWEAAAAAEAAALQGKFWEMHDKLFLEQKEWTDTAGFGGKLEGYAVGLGMDVERFKRDKNGREVENKIRADQSSGVDLGVTGTPTFFVNGRMIGLPGGYEEFRSILDGEVAKAPLVAVHEHADLLVYDAAGKLMDLSREEFMEKDERIHLHDKNGRLIHKHIKGATMGRFLKSLGLATDKTVEWYVGEKKMDGVIENYEFVDLDRIVVGFSKLTLRQVAAVPDEACKYSEKCPERGKPPEEKCVGGLGTDCK